MREDQGRKEYQERREDQERRDDGVWISDLNREKENGTEKEGIEHNQIVIISTTIIDRTIQIGGRTGVMSEKDRREDEERFILMILNTTAKEEIENISITSTR